MPAAGPSNRRGRNGIHDRSRGGPGWSGSARRSRDHIGPAVRGAPSAESPLLTWITIDFALARFPLLGGWRRRHGRRVAVVAVPRKALRASVRRCPLAVPLARLGVLAGGSRMAGGSAAIKLDAGAFVRRFPLRSPSKPCSNGPDRPIGCKLSRRCVSTGSARPVSPASPLRASHGCRDVLRARSPPLGNDFLGGKFGRMNRRTATTPRMTSSTSRTERPIVVSRLTLSFISMPPCRDLERTRNS